MFTTREQPTDARSDQWSQCLVGDLAGWPLDELLLWLNQTGRTAMVRIGNVLHAGVLFVESGQLYRAEFGRLTGETALLALLDLGRGTFQLIQRDIPRPRANISRPTEELLLQLAVARDEKGRAQARAS